MFEKLIQWLAGRSGYYIHFAESCVRKPDNKTKDIGISLTYNKIILRYNDKFLREYFNSVKAKNDTERYGLGCGHIVHNLIHLMFLHPLIKHKYANEEIFDIAADLVVNQYMFLGEIGSLLNENSVTLDSFPDLNLEKNKTLDYYYNKLLQLMNESSGKEPHEMNDSGKELMDTISNGKCDHDWDSKNEFGEQDTDEDGNALPQPIAGEGSEMIKALIEQALEDSMNKISQTESKNRGYVPAFAQELLDAILKAKKPVVNWRSIFRSFITNGTKREIITTRMKRSKRFSQNGIINPGLKQRPRAKVLVAIDTSGSVSNRDLQELFGELLNVHKAGADILVVECDAAIASIYKFEGPKSIPEKVSGRGGTDFNPPMQYSHIYQPDMIVYFTDGECSAPHVKPYTKNILWVVCSTGTDNFDGLRPGRAVKMVHQGE